MFKEGLELIRKTVSQVYPSWLCLLYLIASAAVVIWLLVRRKRNQETLLGLYGAVILITFFLPPFAFIAARFMRDGMVYWRYLWLLPTAVLLPFAAVILATHASRRTVNAAVTLILAGALVLAGRNIYASGGFTKALNKEKLPERTMIAARVIDENIEKTGNTYAYLAAPVQISAEVRELTSNPRIYTRRRFDWTYLKENFPKWYYDIQVLNGFLQDEEHKTPKDLKKKRCNYVLIDSSALCDEDLASRGYEVIYDGGSWHIWYNPDIISKKEARRRKAEKKAETIS